MVALEAQIEKHYRENFNQLVKRVQSRAKTFWNAEDVVQEAYVRALKYQHTYIQGSPFENWFSRILSNSLKDFINAEREYSSIDDLQEDEEGIECSSYPSSVKREVIEAIEELSSDHREIVRLNIVYGYDLRDIVRITDMKYKTIDQIIQRFKKGLKERYNV